MFYFLIFFCDNLITQGHQQDVGALVRLASLYNVAFATNRTTADMIMTSPLFDNKDYKPIMPAAIEKYKNRFKEREEKVNVEESEKIDKDSELEKMWEEISAIIKDKIVSATEQGLNEIELDEGVTFSNDVKEVLRSMGYTILTNGRKYKISWANDGNDGK